MRKRLFSRDYALLWLGMSVSQLGDGAGFIGLMWWVQVQTKSAMLLGAMALVRTFAGILFAPFAGAMADRYSKRWIIVWMDVARGLIHGALAYMAWTGQFNIPVLLILVALSALCNELFGPAVSSAVPLIVDKELLPQANSWLRMTGNVVGIISYASGGVLVAIIGVPLLLLIDAISFILSAVSEVFIFIPQVMSEQHGQKGSMLADVKAGFQYVRANQILFSIMQVAAIINFFGSPTFILLPKFVEQHLGSTAAYYGYLYASVMLGTLAATLVIGFTKFVEENLWLVGNGIIAQGTLMLLFALLPRQMLLPRIGIFLILGFFNGLVNVYFGAVLQRSAAPEHLGKVFGILGMMSTALQPLSQGLAGMLGDRVAVPAILAACGGATGLGGLRFATIPNLYSFLGKEEQQVVEAGVTA